MGGPWGVVRGTRHCCNEGMGREWGLERGRRWAGHRESGRVTGRGCEEGVGQDPGRRWADHAGLGGSPGAGGEGGAGVEDGGPLEAVRRRGAGPRRSPCSISPSRSASCSKSRMMARAARWWKVSLHRSASRASRRSGPGGPSSKLTSHCRRWLSRRPLTRALPSTGPGVAGLLGLARSWDSAGASQSEDASVSKAEGWWDGSAGRGTSGPSAERRLTPRGQRPSPGSRHF